MSDFWIYTVMTIVILHIVIGFIYLVYKLTPTKEDKKKKKENEDLDQTN